MVDEFDLDVLRRAVTAGRIHWHRHALERVLERGIPTIEVVAAVANGELIDVYPTDRPHASALLLHIGAEPLHVVAAADKVAGVCHIITAYRPDHERFESDFKTRRRQR